MAKWTDTLPEEVYTRLCDCCTITEDIPILINARYAYLRATEPTVKWSRPDAIAQVLELLDANGLYVDETIDGYYEIIR